MGITKSTIPDVCKTPSPGGPIPVPYPVIISMANSLAKGTKTVKVDGRNPAAIKGSEYSRCNGDEPGTAGGVKSSTNMKEATWLLYSFDVKIDGKNACRLSDKMMMNHGNTACLGGTIHAPVPKLDSCDEEGLRKLACKCNRAINCSPEDGGPCPEAAPHGNAASNPGGSDCTTLGTRKHTCCELAIKQHADEHSECGFQSEVVYPEGAKNAKEAAKKAYEKKYAEYTDPSRNPKLTSAQARGYLRRDNVYKNALYENGAECIADVVQGDPPKAAYDFKFSCKDKGTVDCAKAQRDKYKKWTGKYPKAIHEDGRDCNCDNKECE